MYWATRLPAVGCCFHGSLGGRSVLGGESAQKATAQARLRSSRHLFIAIREQLLVEFLRAPQLTHFMRECLELFLQHHDLRRELLRL